MKMKMRRKVTSVSRIPVHVEEGGNSLFGLGVPQQAPSSGLSVPICSPNSSAEKCLVQKDLPLVRTISYSNCSPSPCGECGSLRGALGR